MILQALSVFPAILGSVSDEEKKYDIGQHSNKLANTFKFDVKSMKSFQDVHFIVPIFSKDSISEQAVVMAEKEDYKDQEEILKKNDQKGILFEIDSGTEIIDTIMNSIKEQSKDAISEQLNPDSKTVDSLRNFHIDSLVNFKLDENYSDKLNATSVCQSIITLLNRNEEDYNNIIGNLFIKSNTMVLPDEISQRAAVLDSSRGSLPEFYNKLRGIESNYCSYMFNRPELQGRLEFLFTILKLFCQTTRTIDGKEYLTKVEDVFGVLLSDLFEKVDDYVEDFNEEFGDDLDDVIFHDEVKKGLRLYKDSVYLFNEGSFDIVDFPRFFCDLAIMVDSIAYQEHPNHIPIQDLIIILSNYSKLLCKSAVPPCNTKTIKFMFAKSIQHVDNIIVFFLKYVFERLDFSDSFDSINA